MPWAAIIPLITQLGVPAVQFIISKIEAGSNATSADLQTLVALASQTAKDRMLSVLTQQGIDPASDKGKALLALTA